MNPALTSRHMNPRRRALSAAERRLLSAKARDARRRSRAAIKTLYLAAGIACVLWALTLAASDSPWWAITLFWLIIGGVLALWLRVDANKEQRYLDIMAQQFESALARDEAEVYDFRSNAYVEFEEVEDEGAYYAFDLVEKGIGFVAGQEFYPEARFPSLDFSLVYPMDADGNAAHMIIEKRGQKSAPARVIPRAVKLELEMPAHLEAIDGRLEDVEVMLRGGRRNMQ